MFQLNLPDFIILDAEKKALKNMNYTIALVEIIHLIGILAGIIDSLMKSSIGERAILYVPVFSSSIALFTALTATKNKPNRLFPLALNCLFLCFLTILELFRELFFKGGPFSFVFFAIWLVSTICYIYFYVCITKYISKITVINREDDYIPWRDELNAYMSQLITLSAF